MVSHVVFDFDGTIVNSAELTLNILNALAEKYSFKTVSLDEAYILRHLPVMTRFRRIGVPPYLLPRMAVDALALYRQMIGTLHGFKGMSGLMQSLKDLGLCLSVVSSNSVENIEAFCARNCPGVFDHIVSAHSLFGKHRTIKNYLHKYQLKPEEIIYVGDERRDVDACRAIGVEIIAVTWGFDPVELLLGGNPHYVAHNPEDILKIVREKLESQNRLN